MKTFRHTPQPSGIAPVDSTPPYSEALKFLYTLGGVRRAKSTDTETYRLDRMEILSSHFASPEKSFRVIHIAGSKGKGSTAAFIASALQEWGFKTGLYLSPHISDFRERITLAGEFIDSTLFAEEVKEIALEYERGIPLPGPAPSFFETVTLLAFKIFKRLECEWAVVETGLGGRLDATNIVSPEGVVLTPIELEHTDILGSTLEAIAMEKAGIIKQGIPVFASHQRDEAIVVFKEKSRQMNAPLHLLDNNYPEIKWIPTLPAPKIQLTSANGESLFYSLRALSRPQSTNSALALLTLKNLFKDKPLERAIEAISATTLPGRMEVVSEDPPILLDGAHTPVSVKETIDTFLELWNIPEGEATLLFSAVSGKEHKDMANEIKGRFSKVILTTTGSFRSCDAPALRSAFQKVGQNAVFIESPTEAVCYCLKKSSAPLLATGSFFLIGEIRDFLYKMHPLTR